MHVGPKPFSYAQVSALPCPVWRADIYKLDMPLLFAHLYHFFVDIEEFRPYHQEAL